MKYLGKKYGSEKTHLTLTEKAQRLYNETDPLNIFETETETGYKYTVTGLYDMEDLTERELINELENIYDSENIQIAMEAAQNIIENGLYNTAVELMDNELREAIHSEFAPCTDLEFLVEYMARHKEKFGIDFVI